jgi:transcriptional regulator with XRE-family HTH domain
MEKDQNHFDAFGIILRKYRLEKELTLERLSERVGVAHSFIYRLETGQKQPSFRMVLKLADALGVAPGEFVEAVVAKIAEK